MSPTRRHSHEEPADGQQTGADVPRQPFDVLVPAEPRPADAPAPAGPPRDRLDAVAHEIHDTLTANTEAEMPEEPAESTEHEAPKTTPLATLVRTLKRFNAAGATDWAASLTYYGLQALFPGIIALVSIIGLFGDPVTTTRSIIDIAQNLSPGTTTDSIIGPIQSLIDRKGAAGVLFVVGLGLALWSASGYVGAFFRASNAIYGVKEGRPFWKLRPLQVGVTLLTVVLITLVLFGLVLTGPVIDAIAGPLGIGDSAVTVWGIAKWPVMVAVILIVLGVLFYASPNVQLPKFRLFTAGAMLAIGVWAVASAGFAFYVANFGSYDKTYGTLGGAISLLVWIWISNCALLLGATLNAEIERTRELRAGALEAEYELQLEPRRAPKPDGRPEPTEELPVEDTDPDAVAARAGALTAEHAAAPPDQPVT